jgi:hypothetical protein
MDEITRDAIVSIGAFAAIFGIAYVFFTTRNRERLTMLDRGVDITSFQTRSQTLKYGLLCVGIAMGILAGAILKNAGVEKSTSFTSMVFLFGGISLIVHHLITRKS